jgi:Flp pilus assembly protein TadD
MDQLTAHLDRGWDLAQRGDIQGAHSSAVRALELDAESPEAHNLLGHVAALMGDVEDALEAYEQAMQLDDTYVEAMLNAAELYLHPLGEHDEVLALCEQVLDLSEFDDEVLDARLLQFDALIAKGDRTEAKAMLGRMPAGPYEHAAHAFLVGRAHFEIGDFDRAAELFQQALTREPEHADALYYLGLVQEERGDHAAALEALLRAREIEQAFGMPPWAPSAEELRQLTEQALSELSPELSQHVGTSRVFVTGMPGAEAVVDGVDPRALALVDVVAGPGLAAADDAATNEVRVFVYALNVVKAAGVVHLVKQQIRAALEREIRAVFLGEAASATTSAGGVGAPDGSTPSPGA